MSSLYKTLGMLLFSFIICLTFNESATAQRSSTRPGTSASDKKPTATKTADDEKSADDESDDAATEDDAETKEDDDADDKDEKKPTTSRSRAGSSSRAGSKAYKREKANEIGPLTENPLLAMEVRAKDSESTKMRMHGEQAYIVAEENLSKYEDLLRSNKGNTINLAEVGGTNIPVMHVDRMAERLKILGEPAGWDLGARQADLRRRILDVTAALRQLPAFSKQLGDSRALSIVNLKGEKELIKVDQLIKKNKIAEAEVLMDEILDSVHSVSILYDGNVSNSICRLLNESYTKVQPIFLAYRREQANEELQKELKKDRPDFAKLLQELQAATAAISSGEGIKSGDETLSGPQWLSGFAKRWEKTYFEAYYSYGIALSRVTVDAGAGTADADTLSQEYQDFLGKVLPGIAGLINVDANRCAPEDADVLYPEYLKAISEFTAVGDPQAISNLIQPSLDALVAKSPDLQADVGSYYVFSSELLRWRQRVADGYMNARLSAYQPVNSTFNSSIPSGQTQQDQSGTAAQIIFDPNSVGNYLMLRVPAPVAIQAISPSLIGKKVYAQAGLSSRNDLLHVTSYENGSVYASIPQEIDLSLAVLELKSALLVTDTLPPLTLEAALGIESARHGDLWQFGGELTDIELEGRLTKITNTSVDDWGLVYLTAPMSRPPEGITLQHVLAHCHLRPDWLRHQYFFVQLN